MKKTAFLLLALPLLQCTDNTNRPDANGVFEADLVTVSAENPGKLLRFGLNEGDRIDSGAVTAILDTTQLHYRKQQLLAGLAAMRSKLPDRALQLAVYDEKIRTLEREVLRLTRLVDQQAAPSKQLDDLRAELTLTRSQRDAAASTLDRQSAGLVNEINAQHFQLLQVEDQLNRSTVTSPLAGTVINKLALEGEFVPMGKPLYTVASLDPLTLRAYFSGNQLSAIRIGQQVKVSVDGPEGELIHFTGTIQWISPKAEFTPKMIQTREERVNQVYAVKISVPHKGELKIGMPGEVRLNPEP